MALVRRLVRRGPGLPPAQCWRLMQRAALNTTPPQTTTTTTTTAATTTMTPTPTAATPGAGAPERARAGPGLGLRSSDVPPLGPGQGAMLTESPQSAGLRKRHQNLDGLVHFRSLQEFLTTKKHVEYSQMRQTFLANGYALERKLGAGAFGQVYLARLIGSPVHKAIKVLDIKKHRSKDYDFSWLTLEERTQAHLDAGRILDSVRSLPAGVVKEHMLRSHAKLMDDLRKEEDPQLRKTRRPVTEHEILQRLHPHPFVASLNSSFKDSNKLCMVFAFYEGGTLRELLERSGRMSEEQARFYAAELAMGLTFLQENNVAHRDIKPDNILLTAEGHVAISDFGLATRLHGGLKTLCGTCEYLAPETLSEKTWSSRYLDWWAFGCTVWELMSGAGKTPFMGPDAQTVFLNTLTAPLRFPEGCSETGKDFLRRILSRDYAKRIKPDEITKHPWFDGVDFERLRRKQVAAPFKPAPKVALPDRPSDDSDKRKEIGNLLKKRPRIEFSIA
jgi:serine/threonine protein kinase